MFRLYSNMSFIGFMFFSNINGYVKIETLKYLKKNEDDLEITFFAIFGLNTKLETDGT